MSKKIIMVVEDDPDDEKLVMTALQNTRNVSDFHVARDGKEALDFLFGEGRYSGRDILTQPQVILLDLKLPGISGLEVLRKVRADSRTMLIPVVVLTSSSDEQDLISGYRLGANSYLRKPVIFENFSKVVQQLGLYWSIVNEAPPQKG